MALSWADWGQLASAPAVTIIMIPVVTSGSGTSANNNNSQIAAGRPEGTHVFVSTPPGPPE